MPTELELITLVVQSGFAGLFVWLLRDVRQEARARETSDREREERQRKEASEREDRLMRLLETTTDRMDRITTALGCVQTELQALRDAVGDDQ